MNYSIVNRIAWWVEYRSISEQHNKCRESLTILTSLLLIYQWAREHGSDAGGSSEANPLMYPEPAGAAATGPPHPGIKRKSRPGTFSRRIYTDELLPNDMPVAGLFFYGTWRWQMHFALGLKRMITCTSLSEGSVRTALCRMFKEDRRRTWVHKWWLIGGTRMNSSWWCVGHLHSVDIDVFITTMSDGL